MLTDKWQSDSGEHVQFCLKGIRVFWGFEKNKFGKVNLVGPGARACHVWLHSVNFNRILVSGGNDRAILIV